MDNPPASLFVVTADHAGQILRPPPGGVTESMTLSSSSVNTAAKPLLNYPLVEKYALRLGLPPLRPDAA